MTNEEFVAAWKAGQKVRIIEMGGMSEGYERCIWDAAVTILEDLLARRPAIQKGEPITAVENDLIEAALGKSPRISEMSGAQAGAAKNAALVFYCNGYEAGLAMAPSDRLIEFQP